MNVVVKKIQRKSRSIFLSNLLKLKKFQCEDSIIIFSEARGGSTWLMEMIAAIPKTCINWEPFHVDSGVVPKDYKLGWIPYLPANEKNTKYLKLISDILSFKISSPYTRKYLKVKKIIEADKVITKFVRANLLLPYFLANFEFKRPPIFLLRHPIDTCLSQLKAFKNNDKSFITDKIPDQVNNERYVGNIDFLRSLETKLELKIANWCMNNIPTINKLSSFENLIIVYYSDLLINPKHEFEIILNKLGFAHDKENILKELNFRQVSSTDFKQQYKSDPQEQLIKNFHRLDKETKERVQRVFDHFDFKLYDAYSPEPKKQYLNYH